MTKARREAKAQAEEEARALHLAKYWTLPARRGGRAERNGVGMIRIGRARAESKAKLHHYVRCVGVLPSGCQHDLRLLSRGRNWLLFFSEDEDAYRCAKCDASFIVDSARIKIY